MVLFNISRCRGSPRVPDPSLYLRESWDMCHRVVTNEYNDRYYYDGGNNNNNGDGGEMARLPSTIRSLLGHNILSTILIDEMIATGTDPTQGLPNAPFLPTPVANCVSIARLDTPNFGLLYCRLNLPRHPSIVPL